MSNKISGLNSSVQEALPAAVPGGGAPAPGVVPGRSPLRGSPAPAASPPSAAENVHITDSASQLASLEQRVRSLPAVDPARVARFTSAIEQGTYTVQPHHVADRLMQLEQALGQLPED